MMPSGNPSAGACCPQCGSPFRGQGLGASQPANFPMMPGTFPAGAYGPAMPPMPMNSGQFGLPQGFGGFAPTPFNPAFGMPPMMNPWSGAGFSPINLGWGLGGTRQWGGTYSPQFLTTGLPTDGEITEMVYDAIDADPIIPYDADINVDSDAGVVTLSGTVMSKEIKHAAGDDAWWMPGVDDVHNDLQVAPHHVAYDASTQARQRGMTGESSGRSRKR